MNNNNSKRKKTLKERYMDFAYTDQYKQKLQARQASNNNYSNTNYNSKKKKKSKIFSKLFIVLVIGIIFLCIIFIPYIFNAIKSYEKGFDTSRIDVESVPHLYDKDGKLICIMYRISRF